MSLTRRGIGAAVSAAVGLCLYLPFLSRNYDLNGIMEAKALDLGFLFSQNHLLYRPFVFLLKDFLTTLGISLHSIALMQILTAISGAIALGAVYLAISDLTRDWRAASVGTAWLATSFSYWYFSTDISYIVPSAAFVAIALFLLARLKSPILAGCAAAAAILTWQANIFLLPFLVVAPWVFGLGDRRKIYRHIFISLITCAVTVAAAYLLVAVLVVHQSTLPGIVGWLADYGGGRLPMWGRFAFERLQDAVHSAAASIYPLENRLVIGELANPLSPPSYWEGASVAFFGLCMWPFILMLRQRSLDAKHGRILLWLAMGYLSYIPFIIWWDPGEIKWFTIPNVFLAGILGALWGIARWTVLDRAIALAGILTLCLSNFSSTIWTRRSTEGPAMQIARCVAEHMNTEDLFISEDWAWDGYLSYLYGHNVINTIGDYTSPNARRTFLDAVDKAVSDVQQKGGNVYVPDLGSYAAWYVNWLQSQTGIHRAELERFSTTPAFSCGGLRVRRLTPLQDARPATAPLVGH